MTPWGYTKDLPADYADQASSLLCIYVYSFHCYHYASFQTYFPSEIKQIKVLKIINVNIKCLSSKP
jgi:hypothetical protein